jgi:phenylalanine-4-hydroxylase
MAARILAVWSRAMRPLGEGDLVQLDPDHPGFRDVDYRARRNVIAHIALDYREGPVPDAPYTAEEHGVWAEVWDHLAPLHRARACRECLDLAGELGLPRDRIPQLAELNPRLEATTGFRMLPVAGLVGGQKFLERLGERVFMSTQYVRHAARPLYTPEPDVIHELVGHAATLIHPGLAELNRRLGLAAEQADAAGALALERVYWYTLEFGAAEESGEIKAYGAGLLSSYGEIQRFTSEAELLPFDLDRMARTPYDPTTYQPHIFVAPSFQRMIDEITAWLERRRFISM